MPNSPSIPETASAATRETPESTPAPSSSSRSTAAPAPPVHPKIRHTKPEESLPPLSRSHPHPASRSATTTARTTPTRHSPDRILIQLLDPRQPRLERLPPIHPSVNFIPRIHPPQRKIRKRPLSRIKAIPLIDERRRVLSLSHLPPERRLPSIGIAGPFIQRQDSRKRTQVPHPVQHLRRQVIEHLPFHRAHHIARPELKH